MWPSENSIILQRDTEGNLNPQCHPLKPPNHAPLDFILATLIKFSFIEKNKKKSYPITGLNRPWGFQEVEAPRFQDNRHMKVVRLSAISTVRLYATRNIPGTHFCYSLCRPQGQSATGMIISMKRNFNDTIGNRTRDLQTSSTVPQPTAPPRVPKKKHNIHYTTMYCKYIPKVISVIYKGLSFFQLRVIKCQ